MLNRESPVARFVVMSLLLVALALFGALGTLDYVMFHDRLATELRARDRISADQLAASLALPVWNFDQAQLDKIAESVLHDREAAGVIIHVHDVSAAGGFRTYGTVRDGAAPFRKISADQDFVQDGLLREERPIVASGELLGDAAVYYSPQVMQEATWNHLIYQVSIFAIFGAILTASLYVLLWHTVLHPLRSIEQYAGEVSSGGTASLSGGRFRGELERLRASIQKMVDLLASRYGSLKQNEARLSAQLQFEALVAGISSMLVAAEPENMHAILTRALAEIGRTLDADRVVLGRTDEQSGDMIARAYFRRTDPPFPDRLVISDRYPALWRRLREGRISNIRNTAALGADEEVDRRHFQEVGIQSQVTAPVLVEGHLHYILAVAGVGRTIDWSDEAVARIKVLAEVLATTALRCEAEEVVRSSERQFRTFIEQAPVPIVLVPSPDGSPIYFNPAFTRVFGYTREDLHRPEEWWPLIYPDPEYRAIRHAAWESKVAAMQATGGFQDTGETEMRAKNGEVRFAQTRITTVEGFRMSFLNDMTERRRAEMAQRLTQYAVDHTPVMIFRLDMAGQFVYGNDAVCARLGCTPAELMNLHIWDIARTVSAEQWAVRAQSLREQGSTFLESVYATRDNTAFPVEVRILYVEFSGIQQFFVYAQDITDRKAAQEAEHAYTRRIHKLATALTHAEERQRRELATILHDEVGQNLFAATTQLIALRNRADSEHAQLDTALALLDEVTRDTRELTFELCPPVLYQLGLMPALQRLGEQFAARHGVTCTVTGKTDGPADLNARGLAYQAVRELLNNAAKHAGARHVTIDAAESDEEVRLEVADDGAGFDPANVRPGNGGFGLFHLRERIELLGGSLKIDSAPGRGTRVQLRLPLNVLQPVE